MSFASGPPLESTGGGSSEAALVDALALAEGTGGADADALGVAEAVSTGAGGMSLEPEADAEGAAEPVAVVDALALGLADAAAEPLAAAEEEPADEAVPDELADAEGFTEVLADALAEAEPTGLLEPACAAPSFGEAASKSALETPIEPNTKSRRTRTMPGPLAHSQLGEHPVVVRRCDPPAIALDDLVEHHLRAEG